MREQAGQAVNEGTSRMLHCCIWATFSQCCFATLSPALLRALLCHQHQRRPPICTSLESGRKLTRSVIHMYMEEFQKDE